MSDRPLGIILAGWHTLAAGLVWAVEWMVYGRRPWPAWYRRRKLNR